jgi:hypothetical protein
MAKDLSRDAKCYASSQKAGSCCMTNVVHVQVRKPYFLGNHAPNSAEIDGLAWHATFKKKCGR